MTEAEWLACCDPVKMLEYLRDKASDRKLRLLTCACGRFVSHLLTDPRSKEALPVAERFADGLANTAEIEAVFRPACNAAAEALRYAAGTTDGPPLPSWAAAWVIAKAVIATSTMRGEDAFFGAVDGIGFTASALGGPPITLLHDIFGNPFLPVTASPAWLTSTVVSLAHGTYEERAFDSLPIIADALEEAGCTDAAILGHCRGPGPHVRGCWVVDLLLGKP
jgi:hypothetical protein